MRWPAGNGSLGRPPAQTRPAAPIRTAMTVLSPSPQPAASDYRVVQPYPAAWPYNEDVVRAFVIATMFWGIAAFTLGVYLALELAFPAFNLGLEWFSFGRLRPAHTSAAIFAFGGNALLGTSLYVVQRTCRARLWGGDAAAWFVFWGYQFFIVMAAWGYLTGVTQSREYAEPEWYLDLWLAIVWVAYLALFLGTLIRRREPHIYVANWFYLAFIVTVAILHIV